jgi:hypothetical protein
MLTAIKGTVTDELECVFAKRTIIPATVLPPFFSPPSSHVLNSLSCRWEVNKRTSGNHSDTANQIHHPALDAIHISRTLAEGRFVGLLEVRATPAYACEEAIFAENGDGVEEEDGDIYQRTEAE